MRIGEAVTGDPSTVRFHSSSTCATASPGRTLGGAERLMRSIGVESLGGQQISHAGQHPILEFLVHAWDFARASGREVVVSEPLSEYVLGVAGKVITPEARGYAGFADPVATGPDAGILDRLIAFTGRQPAVHASAN